MFYTVCTRGRLSKSLVFMVLSVPPREPAAGVLPARVVVTQPLLLPFRLRLEDLLLPPEFGQFGRGRPNAAVQAGQEGGAERRHLRGGGSLNNIEKINR